MKGLDKDPALLKELRALGLDEGDLSASTPPEAKGGKKPATPTPPSAGIDVEAEQGV